MISDAFRSRPEAARLQITRFPAIATRFLVAAVVTAQSRDFLNFSQKIQPVLWSPATVSYGCYGLRVTIAVTVSRRLGLAGVVFSRELVVQKVLKPQCQEALKPSFQATCILQKWRIEECVCAITIISLLF